MIPAKDRNLVVKSNFIQSCSVSRIHAGIGFERHILQDRFLRIAHRRSVNFGNQFYIKIM